MGLGKIFTKKCAQSHVSSLWRLTRVFDGTWKNFHKKVCPVTRFFAVETILSFWWDLESFDKKVWSVTRFFAVQAITSFWWVLEKFSQKSVPSYTFCSLWRLTWVFDATWKVSTKKVWPVTRFFSLWRLTWVFDGTWKNFHKKVCPVTRFFAVVTILSFWEDLKSFDKKVYPVTGFFAVETILSFWWDLESFDKKVWSVTRFFAVQAISSFWWDLEKFSQKSVPSYTFCSLWRLTWVFDGTRKNFHKKVYPVTRFFAVETNLSFWCDLESFDKKSVTSYTFFRCGD